MKREDIKPGGSGTGLIIAGAAVVGCALLAYLLPRAHPAALWKVRSDRQQSIAKAREVAASLGVDVSGWSVTATGNSAGRAFYYALHGKNRDQDQRFTPVYPIVTFKAPNKGGQAIVELSSNGDVNSWERKGSPKSPGTDAGTARTIAQNALSRFMGGAAGEFRAISDAAAANGALSFAWERAGDPVQRFEASVEGDRLIKAELKPTYGNEFDAAFRGRKRAIDWVETGAAILLFGGGVVFAAGFYVYGAVRRAVKHRFVLALGAAAMAADAISWFNWDRFTNLGNVKIGDNPASVWLAGVMMGVFFALVYLVVCGAVDVAGRNSAKTATLRSIFSSAVFNRRAGISILAGLLFGPLITAIPLLISALHLFGSEPTGDLAADVVYSVHTGVQATRHIIDVGLLGLFGFGAGFVSLYIRKPSAAYAAMFVSGMLMLATVASPSETSSIVFLLKGALLFLAYRFLLQRFDLLAVLSAAYASHVIWNAGALLLQPARSLHVSGVSSLTFLTALTGIAALVAWRGRELSAVETVAPALATSQREALMAEFSIAHRVQQHMLPLEPPVIPGCTIAATCHPAREVGGDLFDFLKLPDGRWAVGVGDVSGKGVPASLYMTLTKGLLVATTQDSSDLLDIVANVNGHIHTVAQRKIFVTLALGAFDPETRTFDHVRAGHNPTVWRRASDNTTKWLTKPGMGLGMASDRLFRRATEIESVQLDSGDVLVFYSDGLTEAMNSENEQFGEDRLAQAVESADGGDANAVRESILTRVRAFLNGIPAQDDMTLVVLRVN